MNSYEEQKIRQSAQSESMLIGQINLQPNNKQLSQQHVASPLLIVQTKYICSQCTFEKTVQLSQEILQLREKLLWYQSKTKQLQQIANGDEQKVHQLILPLQTAIQKQIPSDAQAQRQLKHLHQQLLSLQQELNQQQQLSIQCQSQYQQFIKERTDFEQDLFMKQFQYQQLTKHYHQFIMHKQHLLVDTLNTLQKTNFVSILYTITFENNRSLLNGQKISHQNTWKIVQILLFYQTKYQNHYHPLYHIFWSQMKLQKDPQQQLQQINSGHLLDSINLGNLLRKQSAKQVGIDCDSEQIIMNKWIPCFLLQLKHLFNFLNRQAGHEQKLRYEITKDGEFQLLKGKSFKNTKDKFTLSIKYLMTNIDQINKIEFFAKQKRINSQ